MMAEIHLRGPIVCGVDGNSLLMYSGGILSAAGSGKISYFVSVVGWSANSGGYWSEYTLRCFVLHVITDCSVSCVSVLRASFGKAALAPSRKPVTLLDGM